MTLGWEDDYRESETIAPDDDATCWLIRCPDTKQLDALITSANCKNDVRVFNTNCKYRARISLRTKTKGFRPFVHTVFLHWGWGMHDGPNGKVQLADLHFIQEPKAINS